MKKRLVRDKVRLILNRLYGPESASIWEPQFISLFDEFRLKRGTREVPPLNEKDVVLITYADQFQQEGVAPLQSLLAFYEKNLKGLVSGIHILPFFPFTSDDGFSISDYDAVNPVFGGWEDIQRVSQESRLMVDAVINHCSRSHLWFEKYLSGDPEYSRFFISADPAMDWSMVVRPRTLPLLTPFDTFEGQKHIWTTFSADQVDLNFREPALLFRVMQILLRYIEAGAQIIRLDAIAYIWKEPDTTCIHLPQVHCIIQLMRALIDWAAPGVQLITETNVPHAENISYFGDGMNEAGMVYNFALPPLVLNAFYQGSAVHLTDWASGLETPSDQTAFFNFLASHDGIGLNPVRGIIPEADIDALVEGCMGRGGLVSYKTTPDGGRSPYELNINYLDALGDPSGLISEQDHIRRFLTAHALLLSLRGVPGVYVHSLLGSRGWPEGAKSSGQNRRINRQKFSLPAVQAELEDPRATRHKVFAGFKRMLSVRRENAQFSPAAGQEIIKMQPEVFINVRHAICTEPVVCISNFSKNKQTLMGQSLREYLGDNWRDLLSRETGHSASGQIDLEPYQTRWLTRLKE